MRFGRKQLEALLDPGTADLVAETADGVVELVIVADAPCTGSDGQLSSLQDKVQTYVSFAVDGQMGRSIPKAVGVTGQVNFDSHVVRVLTAAVELVNELTPGRARGMPYPAPTGIDRVRATAEALGNEAAHDGDTDRAANETYRLLPDTSPQCQSRVKAAAHRARKAAS